MANSLKDSKLKLTVLSSRHDPLYDNRCVHDIQVIDDNSEFFRALMTMIKTVLQFRINRCMQGHLKALREDKPSMMVNQNLTEMLTYVQNIGYNCTLSWFLVRQLLKAIEEYNLSGLRHPIHNLNPRKWMHVHSFMINFVTDNYPFVDSMVMKSQLLLDLAKFKAQGCKIDQNSVKPIDPTSSV